MSDPSAENQKKDNTDVANARAPRDRSQHVKRRQYVINKSFQFRWLIEVFALCVCFMLLAAATIISIYLYFSWVDTEGDAGIPLLLLGGLVIAYLAGFVVLTYNCITLTHRTAGPMFHFSRIFKVVAKGDLGARVYLRQKDFWKETAADFNQAMDAVQKRQARLEEAAGELAAAAKGGSGGEALDRAIGKVSELIPGKDPSDR